MKVSRVKESNIGVYVATAAGIPIDDGDGHLLCIDAVKGDKSRLALLNKSAVAMGYENIGYVFLDSVRKVSDDEYARQQYRLENGLTPDEYDIGELIEAKKKGAGK